MKKIIYSAFFLTTALGMAQTDLVGINTDSPEVLLHITDFDANDDGVIEEPRVEVGLKVPTHTSFPTVPFDTTDELTLSKEKNGMLIHLNRPASTAHEELQGFFFWDDNNHSWQNIIDTREVNLDTSKVVAVGKKLTANIVGTSTESVVFSEIKSFDEDFYLDEDTNEIIIGKPADYYILLIGGVEKGGTNVNAAAFTAKINKRGYNEDESSKTTVAESEVAIAANKGTEYRTANFYISKILQFEKNDRVSVTVTGSNNVITSGYVKSPFSFTIIKLD